MAAAGKKLLRSHVCVVKFRRVCEFVGVFLPSNNPSEGSSVCGWLFFCSLKITILGPTPDGVRVVARPKVVGSSDPNADVFPESF